MSEEHHDISDSSVRKHEEIKEEEDDDDIEVKKPSSQTQKTEEVKQPLNEKTKSKKLFSWLCVRDVLMQNYWRYCASGFIQNFSQYYYWILIPLVAEDLGASAFEFGMIQCLGSLVYALVSLGIGVYVVERVRSGVLARIAFVLFLIACGIILASNKVWALFVAVFISGTGNAFYWGPIQNAVGLEAGSKSDRKTARFSVFHALGKSIGYILGGLLKGTLGATVSFIADMIFSGTQLIFVPMGVSRSPKNYKIFEQHHQQNEHNGSSVLHSVEDITPSSTPEVVVIPHADSDDVSTPSPSHSPSPLPLPSSSTSPDVHHHSSPSPSPNIPLGHEQESREFARNTVFLYLSWIMNFGAYGSMTVVSNQYIKLIVHEDIGFGSPETLSLSSGSDSVSSWWSSSSAGHASSRNEFFLGTFLCLVYLAQMTMFLVGFTTQLWMYHRFFIYIMEVLGCTCLALISVVRNPILLLFIAFGCGLMAGTGYLSSYTYSFHSRGKSGKLVGLQETVLSMSSVILPPLAGLFVSTWNELRAPYWMCSALIVLIMITQEITYQVFWKRWNDKLNKMSIELS